MSILRLEEPREASRWCAARRAEGRSLGFVPTMGALHEGHLSLVSRALAENELACVSIFVNPLQFDEAGDLAAYPRDFAADTRLLEGVGCGMAFTGTLAQFFESELLPGGGFPPDRLLDPGPSARGLEGACRSGHFEGVATIVDRLFEVVAPDRAYFGQKDFQQSLVISDLARRRGGPEVIVCSTSRERSGLARSSRNELLSAGDRARAACLSRSLARAASLWRGGEHDPARLEAAMRAELEDEPLEIEYAAVRDPRRWSAETPSAPIQEAVALVAARLGEVRLIDNHLLAEPGPAPHSLGGERKR